MTDIGNFKKISVEEFINFGYMQELNRNFLNPLGLSLTFSFDKDGKEILDGVWDLRDSPGGVFFEECVLRKRDFLEKKKRVSKELAKRFLYRAKKFGFIIQGEIEE